MIGARPESIHRAENRMEFKKIIDSLNLESPRSGICSNLEEARNLAGEIGFPLIIRPSFTLGGMGGAVAESRDDYINLVDKALRESPIGEALIDESLIGWKEFELEVMRDAADNAVIVCSLKISIPWVCIPVTVSPLRRPRHFPIPNIRLCDRLP